MNKKSFVLSWGRKMFFGLGWALTALVALTYFQSMIIPQTPGSWLYLIVTYIGHYGVLLSLLYFLIYRPVVTLFPSYYVSRFTAIFLLLAANLFIFFDGYLFARYRFHIDSFLWNFIQHKDALKTFDFSNVKLSILGIIAFILFIVLWVHGERIWRRMQARFSNPVKNWYLILIFICFISSHALFMMGEAKGDLQIARIGELFPANYHFSSDLFIEKGIVIADSSEKRQGHLGFNYPAKPLNCSIKEPKNILLIVFNEWNGRDFNEYLTPNLHHFASHGTVFENHFSGGMSSESGYFSLMYALMPVYATAAYHQQIEPAFITQMKKAKMEISFYKTGDESPLRKFLPTETENSIESIHNHLAEREDLAAITPFLMSVYLQSGSISDKDQQVKDIVEAFIKYDLIENTIVIVTGATGSLRTPLLLLWPEKYQSTYSHLTTHYDVLPTVMKQEWNCKNKFTDFSSGQELFSDTKKEVHVAGDYSHLKVIDVKHQTVTTILSKNDIEVRDMNNMSIQNEKLDKELILKTLKEIPSFNRRL